MELVVEELVSTNLEQEIRLERSSRYHVGAISPYIYMHNAPSGTFTITLKRGVETIFAKSFTCADIKTALGTLNNYAHVFYPIIPDAPVQLESDLYTVVLSSSGYTMNASSFLGWIRQHEDLNNILDYVPTADYENPFSIRLKILDRGII